MSFFKDKKTIKLLMASLLFFPALSFSQNVGNAQRSVSDSAIGQSCARNQNAVTDCSFSIKDSTGIPAKRNSIGNSRAEGLPNLQALGVALKNGASNSSSALDHAFDFSSLKNNSSKGEVSSSYLENLNNRPSLAAQTSSSLPADSIAHVSAPPAPDLSLPDAPRPQKKVSHPDYFYRTLLPVSWAMTGLDAYTTARVIGQGGYEMDPLYTYFGNKNTTGVIGSMIGAQVGVTVAAALLHHIGKKHRWVRWGTDVLLAEKTGANIYGAVHNFGVLQTMSAQRTVPHKKLADQ